MKKRKRTKEVYVQIYCPKPMNFKEVRSELLNKWVKGIGTRDGCMLSIMDKHFKEKHFKAKEFQLFKISKEDLKLINYFKGIGYY